MNENSKNIKPILFGIITAFLNIYIFKELFQGIIAFLLSAKQIKLQFSKYFFDLTFEPRAFVYNFEYFILYLSPVIFEIIVIELSSFLIKKSRIGFLRFFLIIIILINLGYLIIYSFYSGTILIMNVPSSNDISKFLFYTEAGRTETIMTAFLLIFLVLFYMNLITKRIMKYITSQIRR